MSIKGAVLALLGCAVLAAPAGASVQVGSSGWQWGNPLPQGNTLRALSFSGATGYAAGDFGTLLKTTDGGGSWSGLSVGTFQGLTVVQALDADTVVAGGGCVARRSIDGGRTFTAIAFTPVEASCRAGLRDLSFVTADEGFLLLDDGSVFATEDGGTQFAPRTAVPGTPAAGGGALPRSIAFLTAARGYAATTEGKVFQTLDAGVSWKLVADGGRSIERLWFADALHGFAVGRSGLFLRAVDGGQAWELRDLGAGQPDYSSIRCADATRCILSTASGAQVVRTDDAGSTPGAVVTPATEPIYAAAFASATRVSAVGASGATVASDDAGTTFAPIGGHLSGRYLAIRAGGEGGTAFAPGAAGALAKTLDGGRTWTRGNVPTTADLLDVSFPSAAVGYALDRDGGLFRTENGGKTWKTLGTGSTRRPRAVYAPNSRVVLVLGPRGARRSTDSGETFALVRGRPIAGTRLDGVAPARGAIFAWGLGSVMRSTDLGRTWTAIRTPGARAHARRELAVLQVAFANRRTGLLRTADGRVWRTRDAGRRWTRLDGVGTQLIDGMAVSSGRTAYLVTGRFGGRAGGYLLRTRDGGATWQPQFVVNTPIQPSGIAAPRGGTDYLLGGDAGLLFSTTGGSAGERSTLTLATRRRRLPKPGRVVVTGRLRPAAGNEQVTVSALAPGGGGWSQRTVTAAANGSFVSSWRLSRGTTTFVAQWAGDFKSAGAGSRVMTVAVGTARPPRHQRRHR